MGELIVVVLVAVLVLLGMVGIMIGTLRHSTLMLNAVIKEQAIHRTSLQEIHLLVNSQLTVVQSKLEMALLTASQLSGNPIVLSENAPQMGVKQVE